MIRVRFLERYCGYFPGADPSLDDELANRLIADNTAVPYDSPAAVEDVSEQPTVEPVAIDPLPDVVTDVPDTNDRKDDSDAGDDAASKAAPADSKRRFRRGR